MSVRMNFEHELETLRENMDAMGKGIQQAFADLLSAIAFNNLEELDRIQKNDRKINEMERKIEAECLLLLTRQQPCRWSAPGSRPHARSSGPAPESAPA